jgi:endonuclease/exonuclease/phosphatase (EEP) superfamily protein YafD
MFRKLTAVAAIALGGAASVATVLAFFGGFWWGFDLIANYRWQAMWAALVASVMYALSGKGLLTAIFVVAVAINAWLILPAWVGGQPAASGEGTVQVTHIDLSGDLDDVDRAIAWIVATDADLRLVAGAPSGVIDAITAADPAYSMLNAKTDELGVAVFARDDWNITTVNDASGAPVHSVAVPSGIGVINVVTAWGPMATSNSTVEQLADRFTTITDTVNASANQVTVIGNLGATKWSVVSRRLLGDTELRDAAEGAGYLATWPTSDLPIVGRWIGIPIDVAYMDPGLAPIDIVVGPDIGADHLPLTVVISPVAP